MKSLARFFKVLADETRLAILALLADHGELCVCDVIAALGITQSKASRHLATLKQAGLVTDRKEGLWSHHALRLPEDPTARAHLALLRKAVAGTKAAAAHVAKLHAWFVETHRESLCTGNCAPKKPRPAARRKRHE